MNSKLSRAAPRIALVDDDKNIVASVSLALQVEGFEVLTYHDGEEGLAGILEHNPDLAVLDVKMPRMDGMELLTKLREKSQIPAIFLTSKDDEIDQVLGLRLGADDYITKPFSQRLLIERIRAVLRRNAKVSVPDADGQKSYVVKWSWMKRGMFAAGVITTLI